VKSERDKNRGQWVIDCGATEHMTRYRELFWGFNPNVTGFVHAAAANGGK